MNHDCDREGSWDPMNVQCEPQHKLRACRSTDQVGVTLGTEAAAR